MAHLAASLSPQWLFSNLDAGSRREDAKQGEDQQDPVVLLESRRVRKEGTHLLMHMGRALKMCAHN
jgi:hypothetical protein